MPEYEAAVGNGTIGQFIDLVYARYARRFPIELPLSEDPSPENLAAVDDNAPVPEPDGRCLDGLSQDELDEEEGKIRDRQALIKKRKKQITTWFSYRYMKKNNVDMRAKDPSNPFTSLLFTLTGKSVVEKPRQKSAVNCWSKSPAVCSRINEEVYRICVAEGIRRNQSVSIWNRVAREQFSHLDEAEKKQWEVRAKEEHLKEVEAWNALNEGKASTTPEDRQRCIEALIRLGQPIIEAMAEATGMNLALYAGGPEPANGGRLSIISLYAGTNNNEDPLTFGQAERAAIVKYFFPVFSRFLRNSFSPEECRHRALAPHDDVHALDNAEVRACGGSLDEAPAGPFNLDELNGDTSQTGSSAPAPPSEPSNMGPVTVPTTAPAAVPVPTTSTDASAEIATASTAEVRPSSPLPPQPSTPACAPSPIGSPPVSPLGSPFRSPTRRGRSISRISTSSPAPSRTAVTPPPPASEPASTVATQPFPSPASGDNSSKMPPSQSPVRAVSGRKRKSQAPASTRAAKRAHDSLSDATRAALTSPPALSAPTPDASLDNSTILVLKSTYKWFAKAIEMLRDETLGKAWVDLVAAWVAFERKFEGKRNALLPCDGRPTAVGDWIARGRSPKWRPKISDSKVYGDAHEAWWIFLQPDWRVGDDGLLIAVDEGEWDELMVTGANGLLSVVASLFFWGSAVKVAGKKSNRWNELVVDTTNVLQHLLLL